MLDANFGAQRETMDRQEDDFDQCTDQGEQRTEGKDQSTNVRAQGGIEHQTNKGKEADQNTQGDQEDSNQPAQPPTEGFPIITLDDFSQKFKRKMEGVV